MNGMFRFKTNNGKNDVSLCIFFKGLTGRILVDGKGVSCLGKNLRIVETSTDKDYQKTLSFLNHPRWFKKILVTLIQGKASQAYALIYPKRFEGEREDLDYLNDKKEVWKEPSTKKERKESFEQLYQKSAKDFYSILPTLEKGLEGEDVLKDIVSYVDDIDHDGKKNGSEVICFSSIWPSYPGTSVKDFEK
jgi:hypothetical protein